MPSDPGVRDEYGLLLRLIAFSVERLEQLRSDNGRMLAYGAIRPDLTPQTMHAIENILRNWNSPPITVDPVDGTEHCDLCGGRRKRGSNDASRQAG